MTLATLFRALLIICIGLATSAATCFQPKPGNINGDGGVTDAAPPSFKSCTTQNVKDIASGIQGDIADALASNDYEGELAKLVAKFTVGEVKCAIEIWLSGNSRKAQADAMMRLQLSRGNTWLSTH